MFKEIEEIELVLKRLESTYVKEEGYNFDPVMLEKIKDSEWSEEFPYEFFFKDIFEHMDIKTKMDMLKNHLDEIDCKNELLDVLSKDLKEKETSKKLGLINKIECNILVNKNKGLNK